MSIDVKRIHIIGRKNHGKTSLVIDLVEEITSRGLSVGTIKHTHHHHELDAPGKDSHKHRTAGAEVVGVMSHSLSAVFIPSPLTPRTEDRYTRLSFAFKNCDLVIVEGDTETMAPKIEVWRRALGTTPLAAKDERVLAVVTDDQLTIDTPVHARKDVVALVTWILRTLKVVQS